MDIRKDAGPPVVFNIKRIFRQVKQNSESRLEFQNQDFVVLVRHIKYTNKDWCYKREGRRVERNTMEAQNRKREKKRGIRKDKGGRKRKCELNERIKLRRMGNNTSPQDSSPHELLRWRTQLMNKM